MRGTKFPFLTALEEAGSDRRCIGHIVDPEYGAPGDEVGRLTIVGDFTWLERNVAEIEIICGVGRPELRRRLTERAEALGCRLLTAIHPGSTIGDRAELGRGVLIGAGAVVNNDVRLDDHSHINPLCLISHDTWIGKYAFVGGGSHLAGKVRIHEGAYVGLGTNVIERIVIGRWSVVGAGSTVTKDIPPNTTAVGSPARVVKERPEGWHLSDD